MLEILRSIFSISSLHSALYREPHPEPFSGLCELSGLSELSVIPGDLPPSPLRTVEQQSSRAAEQQSSRAAEQQQ
jgi:hypothetical protein